MKNDDSKLKKWKEKLSTDETAWSAEVAKMDDREDQYKGRKKTKPVCDGDKEKKPYHDCRLTYELIESEVDTNVPSPKVQAKRPQDEQLAKVIEDMLRNELDRLPMAGLNDMLLRTVPVQGGAVFWVEWDNALSTHTTIGDLVLKLMHPKQIIPQAGIYTDIEDMDHFFLKIPATKASIKRRYKVDVSEEAEEDPAAKSSKGESPANDMVTQYVVYYRNSKGGIGLFSWVNDIILEDLEDYQARRLRHCVECGAVEPTDSEPLDIPTMDGNFPGGPRSGKLPLDFDGNMNNPPRTEPRKSGKKQCPYCGGTKFTESDEKTEKIWLPKMTAHGNLIPGATKESKPSVDENGLPVMMEVDVPTEVPYYKPDIYPVILQKNVSVFGQLLGDSDADAVADQHNSRNRLAAKMLDKVTKAGSYISIPNDARIVTDTEDMKKIVFDDGSVASKALLDVYNLEGNIEQDFTLYNEFYKEARNNIGITDSYQGRIDNTATSGKAKEFSASQAAGRLESKRTMRDEAFKKLFEAMFKFKLAYTDEQRSIHKKNDQGETEYDTFDRYDFLEQDESGEWYWNDDFIFSVDTSASLASNREAMWQETRLNLQQGAFGDPADLNTLILFWTKMESLHYPDAAATKKFLQERLEQQQQAAAAQAQAQQQALAAQQQIQQNAAKSQETQTALQEVGKILGKGSNNNGNSQTNQENAVQL